MTGRYIAMVVLAVILVGCSTNSAKEGKKVKDEVLSFGPLHLTHKSGNLPKLYVDTGITGCKFKPKIDDGFEQELHYDCGWKFK